MILVGLTGPQDSSPGTCIKGPRIISQPYIDSDPAILYANHLYAPTVAMASNGWFRVGWWLVLPRDFLIETDGIFNPQSIFANYDFNADASTWPLTPAPSLSPTREVEPSVGISPEEGPFADAFPRQYTNSAARGLRYRHNGTTDLQLEDCPGFPWASNCAYRILQWQPCVAMRGDGYQVYCFAHPENDYAEFPPFDIFLQVFDPSGNSLLSPPMVANSHLVNPPLEETDSTQVSPSVAFDDTGRIVVVWQGPQFAGCGFSPTVFARIFQWNGTTVAPVSRPFVVNSPSSLPLSTNNVFPTGGANPTVALSTANDGRFIVAWNVVGAIGKDEIHAQYFDGLQPLGKEFRVNQVNTQPGVGPFWHRRIANSAQHTVAYGPEGEVVIAWSLLEDTSDNSYPNSAVEKAYYTMLPAGYAEYQASIAACKGDVNLDGLVNGLDISAFLSILFSNQVCLSRTAIYPADMDDSGVVDVAEVAPFATRILEGGTCADSGTSRGIADCNDNEVPDANDIADGTSQDCNHNFIPDECDVDSNDPDGNELVSADVNANSVPDECEPDCNVNSVPDAWDITQMTSTDVNTNGVPDECEPDCNNNNYPDDYDIAMSTSADCNVNGIPDECETDCNENGVPDDCDIDPADPDGNQQVSADCNADGMPDECNLTLPPPYGSFDCNENGILDECDIASAYSEDANENGIPDECEESVLFGGESMMGGSEQSPVNEEAAWEAFYEWSFSQCWGLDCEATTGEQFQAYMAKLTELGMTMP